MIGEMQRDRTFIITAVATNLIRHFSEDWLGDCGYVPYYEWVIETVDEIMLSKGSEYLKYISKEEEDREDWFEVFGTCFDWYFIDKATEMAKVFLGEGFVEI